jgi:hypothetical protein
MADPLRIEFKTPIQRLQHLVGMHYLEVPAEAVQQLGGTFNVRLLCRVNNSLTFQCGLVALGGGYGYISLNAKRMKELGVRNGDQVEVNLSKDKSPYGLEVPAELAELLEQDEEGNKRFQKLTPGRQRYIIHYVASVKNSQRRIDRAILQIENLKKLSPGKK